MHLVVSQPPPVTGGQRPLLGRMLPNFTGRPLQAVPPRGAAADESAGTCGADSPLPFLGGYIDRTPNTNAVVGVPGDHLLPPHVGGNWSVSLSIDDPDEGLLDAVISSGSVVAWVTGSPPTWEDETPQFQQERLRATGCDNDGPTGIIAAEAWPDHDTTRAPEKTNNSSQIPLENRGNAGQFFSLFLPSWCA